MRQITLFSKAISLLFFLCVTTFSMAQVDIELRLEVDKPFLAQGDQATFTFIVENTGATDASTVVVSYQVVGGDGNAVIFETVAAGETQQKEVVLTSTTDMFQLYAEVVNGSEGDPDSGESNIDRCRFTTDCPNNDTSCFFSCALEDDEVVYPVLVDLEILELSCPEQFPIAGGELTYEMTIRNNSSATSPPTTLAMYQYLQAVYDPFDPPPYLISEAIVPPIPANETQVVSLTYIYYPYEETDFINIGSTVLSFDPSGLTEDYVLDISCQKTTADIEIMLTSDDPTYVADNIMQYNVVVTNNGNEVAKELKVLYANEMGGIQQSFEGRVLSADTDFEGTNFSEQNNLNEGTSVKYWNIPTLEVGETATLKVSYQLSGDIVDMFIDIYSINVNVSSIFVIDENPNNNSASFEFTRKEGLDIELRLEADKPFLAEGEQGIFTFIVDNTGTVDAADVVVVYNIVGGSSDSEYFEFVPAGESVQAEVMLTNEGGLFQLYAEIVNGTSGDIDSEELNFDRCRARAECINGEDICLFTCPLEDDEVIYPTPIDLSILEVSCPIQFPVVDGELTYEMTIRNNSSAVSSPTTLGMFQYIEAIYAPFNPPPHKVSDAIVPSIAAGATETVSLTYTYNPFEETDFNYISKTLLSFDPNGFTDDFDVDIACQKTTADVEIRLTSENFLYEAGNIMRYKVLITNNGDEIARELKVLYASEMEGFLHPFTGKVLSIATAFPDGYLSESNNLNAGTTSRYWNLPVLEVGETAILEVSYQISGDVADMFVDTYTIAANVSSDFLNDTNMENNEASITFTRNAIEAIDLELSISSENPDIDRWESGTFTITLENKGNLDATDVAINLGLDGNAVQVGGSQAIASSGSYFDSVWRNISVPAGGTATLIVNLYSKTLSLEFLAQVTSTKQDDADSTPNNGTCCTANEDDEALFQAESPRIDLELSMEADNAPLLTGEHNILVIYLYNNSRSIANNVQVEVPFGANAVLVEGLSPITSHSSSYDAATNTWTIDRLFPFVTARLELRVRPTADYMPYAQVIAADETDADSTPNNGTCCTPNEDDEAMLESGGNFSPTPILLQNSESLGVYPNPSSGVLHIQGNYTAETTYSIYDALGKRLQVGQLNEGILQVSTLPTGIYYLKIGEQHTPIRFMKMR